MMTKFRMALLGLSAAVTIATTALIKPWEGVKYSPYKDVGGVLTVCYGHTGKDIVPNKIYTFKECDELLTEDVKKTAEEVAKLIKVPVSNETMASLVSFTYNVGVGAFKNSTLLKKLNAGNTQGACNEMLRWVYVNGVKVKGLENRRKAERKLCLSNVLYNI